MTEVVPSGILRSTPFDPHGAEALVEILGLDREQVGFARMAVHDGVVSPANVRRNGLGAYSGHLSKSTLARVLTTVHARNRADDIALLRRVRHTAWWT